MFSKAFVFFILVTQMGFAQWNSFATVSSKSQNQYPIVVDMEVFNDDLYIIGHFDSVDGVPASNIARFDGHSWSSLPIRLEFPDDLITFQNELYILGSTENIGLGVFDDEYITKWDGSTWSILKDSALLYDNFSPSIFRKMEVHNNQLFIGGKIEGNMDFPDEHGLAIWDGSNFVSNGVDFFGEVLDMESNGSTLGISGRFRLDSSQLAVFATWENGTYTTYYPQTNSTQSTSIIHASTFTSLSIDTENLFKNGAWSYQFLKAAGESHIIKGNSLLFSRLGNIFISDTSDLSNQELVGDSTGYGRTIFVFYSNKFIASPLGPQTLGSANLIFLDTAVINSLEYTPEDEEVLLFPNPSQGFFECQNCSNEIQIFNNLGKEIKFDLSKGRKAKSNIVSLENCVPGTYYLKCNDLYKISKFIIY